MLLRCPVCGSKNFFADHPDVKGEVVVFSLNRYGDIVKVHPVGSELELGENTVFYCNGCAWNGTVDELKYEQR